MATLAAHNVAAVIMGYPAWRSSDISPFLDENAPDAAPSIINAQEPGMRFYTEQR
jgi:hypothetical protein